MSTSSASASMRYAEMVGRLTELGLTLSTAESLTAGLLAARIAAVPGASAVLRGGLIVYATDLKHTLAGVPAQVLATCGAVSAETAMALAEGARLRCGTDIGIGLTGVAGPDPQEEKPVGQVFIGIDGPHGERAVRTLHLDGGRQEIRESACAEAVNGLLGLLGNRTGS